MAYDGYVTCKNDDFYISLSVIREYQRNNIQIDATANLI